MSRYQPVLVRHAVKLQKRRQAHTHKRPEETTAQRLMRQAQMAGMRARPRKKAGPRVVTAELIEREIARIALFDPIGIFEPGTFTLRQVAAMPPDVRACIASVKVRTENLASGDGVQDATVEIKFWDKLKALELCAKHFGYVTNKTTVVLARDLRALLAEGRARNAARLGAAPKELGPVSEGQVVEASAALDVAQEDEEGADV